MNQTHRNSVLDIFCGAGGFSEGFRQSGFNVVMGIDSWRTAIETFNVNFGLNCKVRNVLDLTIEDIEALPNTEVIIGSPPCVSFSNSNRSGKANKALGLRLTEAFLRIIAIKKFRQQSVLKAWFMENVPNSLKFIKDNYTFTSLGLKEWALLNNLNPNAVAITIEGNSAVINSADYGSPQKRKRAITGEMISVGRLVVPPRTHGTEGDLTNFLTLGDIRKSLPSPFETKSKKTIQDPLFGNKISLDELTDHFYDTGLYEIEWRASKFQKRNHPYMGRMSFPEREDKPSRTITAMNVGTSRETMIFKSEIKRRGNGAYRRPTVREIACIMGFPVTYQFCGTESSKVRLVGNAVCTAVSSALARCVLSHLGQAIPAIPEIAMMPKTSANSNLNSFQRRKFDSPPTKRKRSRFRKHPFKHGNITVTLSNYNVETNSSQRKWKTSVQYGNGNGYPSNNYPDKYYEKLEKTIKSFPKGSEFLKIINNGFSEKIAKGNKLQWMHENNTSEQNFLEPSKLIEEVAKVITKLKFKDQVFVQKTSIFFKHKDEVPESQVLALYAINKITTIANTK